MGDKLNKLRAKMPMSTEVQSFFDGLEEGPRERLAALVGTAVDRQDQHINEAGDHAVRMVPRMFRGPVKKMLFGE